MTNDDPAAKLRADVAAWERHVSAQWETWIRSPGVLQRAGGQFRLLLESQQRMRATLEAARPGWICQRDRCSRALYDLERLEAQARRLAARLDDLERRIKHG